MRWASHRFVVAFQRSNFGKMLCGRRRRQVDFYFWQSGQVDGQVSFVVGVIFCVPFNWFAVVEQVERSYEPLRRDADI